MRLAEYAMTSGKYIIILEELGLSSTEIATAIRTFDRDALRKIVEYIINIPGISGDWCGMSDDYYKELTRIFMMYNGIKKKLGDIGRMSWVKWGDETGLLEFLYNKDRDDEDSDDELYTDEEDDW
jgi:hypothetical protein